MGEERWWHNRDSVGQHKSLAWAQLSPGFSFQRGFRDLLQSVGSGELDREALEPWSVTMWVHMGHVPEPCTEQQLALPPSSVVSQRVES